MAENPYKSFECPIVEGRSIETVVNVPSIRGYALGYQITTRRVVASTTGARRVMLREAGKSLLFGWFSITALVVNPFLILWNVVRAPFISADYKAIKKVFDEAGIPDPGQQVDAMKVLYGLAAKMITADGRIEPQEIETALQVGRRINADFDPRAFHETVENHEALPEVEKYAAILAKVLQPQQKQLVLSYLIAIAFCDDHFDRSEERLLWRVAKGLEADEAWVGAEIELVKERVKRAADATAAIEAAAPPEPHQQSAPPTIVQAQSQQAQQV